ncbi:MAG: type II toxin-antitoxin system death-on-curing family toxin [Rhizomicrobium sp.]
MKFPRSTLHSRVSIFRLAATLYLGIARNYTFNDGNKRTALLATRAFLYLNRWELEPSQADEVATIVSVANGSLNEDDLAVWLEHNARPHTKSGW